MRHKPYIRNIKEVLCSLLKVVVCTRHRAFVLFQPRLFTFIRVVRIFPTVNLQMQINTFITELTRAITTYTYLICRYLPTNHYNILYGKHSQNICTLLRENFLFLDIFIVSTNVNIHLPIYESLTNDIPTCFSSLFKYTT